MKLIAMGILCCLLTEIDGKGGGHGGGGGGHGGGGGGGGHGGGGGGAGHNSGSSGGGGRHETGGGSHGKGGSDNNNNGHRPEGPRSSSIYTGEGSGGLGPTSGYATLFEGTFGKMADPNCLSRESVVGILLRRSGIIPGIMEETPKDQPQWRFPGLNLDQFGQYYEPQQLTGAPEIEIESLENVHFQFVVVIRDVDVINSSGVRVNDIRYMAINWNKTSPGVPIIDWRKPPEAQNQGGHRFLITLHKTFGRILSTTEYKEKVPFLEKGGTINYFTKNVGHVEYASLFYVEK